jgi:hypothetical protein
MCRIMSFFHFYAKLVVFFVLIFICHSSLGLCASIDVTFDMMFHFLTVNFNFFSRAKRDACVLIKIQTKKTAQLLCMKP